MGNLVLRDGLPESVGMDPIRIDRLRELGASWVKNGDVPSLVLLAVRRGTIVLHEAFGVRRPEDATPNSESRIDFHRRLGVQTAHRNGHNVPG